MRFRFGAIHVSANARKAFEIGLDISARFLARDRQLIGKPERRDPINNAEIDRLGLAPDRRIHAFDRHAEHL